MVVQSMNSICANRFELSRNTVFLSCPEHTHREFEYIGQIKGRTKVFVGGKSYILGEGEAVLIFPFQAHRCESVDSQLCETCIFSSDMVEDFFRSYGGKSPKDNVFKFNLAGDIKEDNVYLCRSAAYSICGEFERQNSEGKKSDSSDENVLISLLLYVEKNYCGKCSLSDAAEELGYDYSYVSKIFKRKTGMSFNRYVNSLRVKKSLNMIKNGNMNLSEIMLECGFTSLRSFDRNFKRIMNLSPSEYRKSDPRIDDPHGVEE